MVQLVTSKDFQVIQQHVIAPVPTTTHVNTNLPTYVSKGCTPQPLDGGQHGDSFGGSSPGGNLLGGRPFNPHVRSFEWPTLDPHIFIAPLVPTTCCTTCTKTNNQVAIQEATISNLCQKH